MEFGEYLRKLRGNRSLREIERLSGVSHTYLSSLEKGVDPRTGARILPSPDILLKLSKALGVTYPDLMTKAGYLIDRDSSEFKTTQILISIIEVLNEIEHTNKYTKHAAEQFHKDLLAIRDGADISISDLKRQLYDVEPDGDANPSLGGWKETEKIERLLSLLDKVVSDDIDMRILRRDNEKTKELIQYLDQTNITYNGHNLTDLDRKRILDMLKALFPEYSTKENK